MRNDCAFPATEDHCAGLTKREYMATHILAGLAANPPQFQAYNLSEEEKARKAVTMADQLIEALNRGPRG